MEIETFAPLLTREIPLPMVEAGVRDDQEGPLPRSLAQAAGGTRARRGVASLLGVLLILVVLQAILVLKYSKANALVVYQAGSRSVLVRR